MMKKKSGCFQLFRTLFANFWTELSENSPRCRVLSLPSGISALNFVLTNWMFFVYWICAKHNIWFFNLRLRSDDKAAFQLLRVCVELGHVGSRILIIFKCLLSGYCLLWVEWRWGRFDFRLLRHASLSLDSGNMRQTSTLDFHFKWSELGWPKRTRPCYHATVEPKNTGQMCKFCCQIAVGLHPTLFSALSHSSVLCSGVVTVVGWSQKCAFEFLLIKSVGVVQMERTQLPT